jgi:hypothetical protein
VDMEDEEDDLPAFGEIGKTDGNYPEVFES